MKKNLKELNFILPHTYRLFKLPLENDCEDYGQSVIYKGTIENNKYIWKLDDHHTFLKDKNTLVYNTWKMLKDTRFQKHFEFNGNFENHFGIFEGCGKKIPFDLQSNSKCC